EDPLQELSANILVAEIRLHVDVLDRHMRLLFGNDLYRFGGLYRGVDIADKLPIAFRHQEVGWEAIEDGNVYFSIHRVEVAIGDVFLLPLPLKADNGINVMKGAGPNTNLLHMHNLVDRRPGLAVSRFP